MHRALLKLHLPAVVVRGLSGRPQQGSMKGAAGSVRRFPESMFYHKYKMFYHKYKKIKGDHHD